MKKKSNIISLVLFTFILLTALTFNSCSDDDSPDYKSVRTDTYTIYPVYTYGSVIVGSDNYSYRSIDNHWVSGGASFYVFVSQNGILKDLGIISSKEDRIKTEDQKKPIHVKVPIPEDIDVNQKYNVFFINGTEAQLTANRIACDVELNRDRYVPKFYKSEGGKNQTAQSFNLSVSEGLYVINNSKKSIKVKMLGYDVQNKWYAYKGTISINPDGNISTNVTNIVNELETDKQTVKPEESGWFLSSYVPTGAKIKDARLIMEIDGKVVKTPPASSEATIECGKYYVLIAKWDGENLEWN